MHISQITALVLCTLSLLYPKQSAASEQVPDCQETCAFVLKNQQSGAVQIVNPARAKRPLTPYSSFKIANTLIALELGVIRDLSQTFSVNTQRYPIQAWWPTHWYTKPLNIRQAFAYSALPIYQQIATEIGAERMQGYLDKFAYGNQDISSGIDSFWLNGSLKISAVQQVDFLQKLFLGELLISGHTLEPVDLFCTNFVQPKRILGKARGV